MAFTIPNEADAFHADQAEPDSIDFGIMAAGFGLTGVLNGCGVTAQGSPDMTCAVAAGQVIVAGTVAAVAAGNVTITAADGTNPRIDLVVSNNAGTKSVTAGTAAASPVMPAIPANSVVLAAVYVPASDTTIASNQITDKRVLLASVPFGRGTTLPSAPVSDDHFWRTDLDLGVYFDGTRWLSTKLYSDTVPLSQALPIAATSTFGRFPLWRTTFGMYLVDFYATYFVSTTNDGSNFWTVEIGWLTAANAFTTLANVTTAAETVATWNNEAAAIGAVLDSNARAITGTVTTTGGPGGIHLAARISYRLIVT